MGAKDGDFLGPACRQLGQTVAICQPLAVVDRNHPLKQIERLGSAFCTVANVANIGVMKVRIASVK